MSTRKSNQAVAERKDKQANSKAKEKTEYRRAAGADQEFVSDDTGLREGGRWKRSKTGEEVGETMTKKRPWKRRNRTNASETEVSTEEEKKARSKKRKKRARVRIFPIWLRIIVVLILAAFALAAGLMIGYGVVGDGTPIDALKIETWKHIIDIVVKE